MKILQIIQRPQFRGAEIFACQLAEQLQGKGHTVHVLFLFGASHPFQFSLPFHFLEADESKRWHDFIAYKRLANFIKQQNFDIVQANAGDTLKYAALAKMLFGYRSKLIFRNANKLSDFLRSPLQTWLNQQLVKQLDGVASVSELCKADFEKTFPTKHLAIRYLPIGVSTSKSGYITWQQAGIPFSEADQVLVHVGSFVPEKNHAGLIRIFEQLVVQFPHIKLLLIGEGKTKESIKASVEQNSKLTSNQVFFAGNRSDVQQILPLCKALVLPSLIEGLPAVILEAMIAKIPVIAYNVGGISEVVKHLITGYLVPATQEHEFTEHCIAVLKSERGENNIPNNAFHLVETNFSNAAVAQKFENFYSSLVNR